MKLGSDFFNWFRFITQVIKLFIQVFGDNDENNELKKNHIEP